MQKKIKDYGEVIHGSRKELWKAHGGFSLQDFLDAPAGAAAKYCTKANCWPTPDYQQMVADGCQKENVFWLKLVHDAAPSHPYDDGEPSCKDYLSLMDGLKALAKEVAEADRVPGSYPRMADWLNEKDFIQRAGMAYRLTPEGRHARVTNKLVNVPYKPAMVRYNLAKAQFLFSEEEEAAAKYGIVSGAELSNYKGAHFTCDADGHWVKVSGYGYSVNVTYGFIHIYPVAGSPWLETIIPDDKWVVYPANGGDIVAVVDSKDEAVSVRLNIFRASKALSAAKAADKRARKVKPVFPYPADDAETQEMTGGKLRGESDFLSTLGMRGVQFGNYLSQNDRQLAENRAYASFCNLAKALDIANKDVSFSGKLGLAFGARGNGGANAPVAHYEPMENVINITKKRGAGSLGHEWIHALMYNSADVRPQDLLQSLKHNPDGTFTKFYMDALTLDKKYRKEGGYWHSDDELIARAGAAYIKDKCTALGIHDVYLSGHADGRSDGVSVAPLGEERIRINKMFDELIAKAKQTGLLHERPAETTVTPVATVARHTVDTAGTPVFSAGKCQQMKLFF